MTDICRVSIEERNYDLQQMEREKFTRSRAEMAQSFINDCKVTDDIMLEAMSERPLVLKAMLAQLPLKDNCELGQIVRAAVYNYVLTLFDKGILEESE